MKQTLILMAISMLTKVLSPELVRKGFESIKAKIEAYVEGTENTVDDFLYAALSCSNKEIVVFGDFILDFIEDFVLGTASTIDDAAVLPICGMIRDALSIPDND